MKRQTLNKDFVGYVTVKLIADNNYPFLFRMKSFEVPEESVASIVGQRGANIKAMMDQTGAKISIKRRLENPLATVFISGGRESLAESLVILAVRHFFSAICPLTKSDKLNVCEEEIVAYDIRCFVSQISSLKVV